MLDLEFAEVSIDGRTRDHNEDYVGHMVPATPEEARWRGWLFALADGVGGQDRGEVASMTAVESMLTDFGRASSRDGLTSLLPKLVRAANHRVYVAGAGSRGARAIATTLVTCALRYDRAVVAHVGDSRCYLVRRGAASQLTRDHTLVNEQLRMGLLSARQAASASNRNVLSRSLGNDLFVNVDTSDHLLTPGDTLLLCSDGLHNSVAELDMVKALGKDAPLQSAAEQLVDLANHRDGSDNISVQLIRVRAVERVGMYRGRLYKLR